ncbi:helix-turn-helix transcriptional regulator [Clostridioides difficile]|uniref:helix-turn-helix domain-containing protein n=1 Tax=Clostridioides difficile TaxID=1496 RepID=UPI001C177A2C|nr:helix-turn-helix domain-containing protein [Clostridioides difficile]HBF6274486.1 helix-turn-helix transcriptional regulator [Clostridioides difficile]HBY3544818.1 helix-turn-helix transcriptional regulator [Clostridioides difficile]HBY3547530.1 helix-turn-helix transcriptional regulator [Clostridioides difficile]
MENQLSLGEKIRLARTNKGLKQSDLSNMLEIRNTAVSSWENNQNKPDINILESLCCILEVSPNYLI